uniref:Uncharacterized protein n=1 Tax=Avena sativa TaxID=4498 RepID=A0ACD5Y2K5_AVESA
MAAPPTEEQLSSGSGEAEVYHDTTYGDGYPGACTDPPADLGGPTIKNTEPHDHQALVFTDSDQLSCRTSEIVSTQKVSDDNEDINEYDAQSIDEDSDEEDDICQYDEQLIDDDSDGEKCCGDEEDSDEYDAQLSGKDSETNCPGKNYSKEEVGKIVDRWFDSFTRQFDDCLDLRKEILARGDKNARLPPYPLKVLPEVTGQCIGRFCYHREYRTHDTSTTASVLGYRRPKVMLQVFSLRLASYESYPINVYGIFAVRDDLEPLRNLVFNRPRDDAVTIEQDFFTLPLCSPCRGMHVLDHALLEVDLWVKKDGDGSSDEKLHSAYVEIYVQSRFDLMRTGQIPGESCSLEIDYMFLSWSVEAVIQVFAKVDHPRPSRFTAFSSGFDHEIVLFGDKFAQDGKVSQHVVTVKQNGKLDICLKLEKAVFRWSFQDGVAGTLSSPDHSILEYGQFLVRVLFAPKNSQPGKICRCLP